MFQESYNLQKIRQLYGLTQTEFARKAKMSRELVSKIENGKAELKKPTLKKLQSFLEMHSFSENSQDVNILGKASSSYLSSRLERKNEKAQLMVPLVGIKAQAGYVKSYEQVDYLDTLHKYSLPPGVNPVGAVWRYFEIDGDSMEPTLSSGDVILATMVPVEDWSDIKDFCIYIVHTVDQLLVKRVFKKSAAEWVLLSDNEDQYPQALLPIDNIQQVWMMRRHIRSKAPMPKEFKIRC
jgi:phage repressor protein C with HTH and peptisase S24 domain